MYLSKLSSREFLGTEFQVPKQNKSLLNEPVMIKLYKKSRIYNCIQYLIPISQIFLKLLVNMFVKICFQKTLCFMYNVIILNFYLTLLNEYTASIIFNMEQKF